ncbi:MAG: hypothetical protein Q9227_003316 [Pyrenula ochraceoflavens]
MSSFFTLPSSQRKRKRGEDQPARPNNKKASASRVNAASTGRSARSERGRREREESVLESESEGSDGSVSGSRSPSEASDVEDETAGERRLRLAQTYLDNIREEVDEAGFDAKEVDRDLIAQRLKEDVDEAKGRQYRLIAQNLDFAAAGHCSFRSNTKSTTAVAACPPYIYTASKDKALMKWEIFPPSSTSSDNPITPTSTLLQPKKPKQIAFQRGVKVDASSKKQHGHSASIIALAASPNNEFVVTGSSDKSLIVWSTKPHLKPLKTFRTHRDAVLSLSFPPIVPSTHPGLGSQLFSGSADRTLKTYSLAGPESLAYVETLFGHQDHVVGVAAMGTDQCVSVGSRDRTARMWKVVDESQLVFRGDSSKNESYHSGSLDCVVALPPQHFVTGSDSGAIQLWSMHKKKPLYTVPLAHGVEEPEKMEDVTSERDREVIERLKLADKRRPMPRQITALATVPGTDVVVSGSWDGWVRAWKVADDKRSIIPLGVVGQNAQSSNGNVNNDHLTNGASETGADNDHHLQTPSSPAEKNNSNRPTIPNNDHHHPSPSPFPFPSPPPPPPSTHPPGPIHGIVNALTIFERRRLITNEFGGQKEGETLGLCIVAGTGKEPRLGRWRVFPEGRNGAVLFEVPVRRAEGVGGGGDGGREERRGEGGEGEDGR